MMQHFRFVIRKKKHKENSEAYYNVHLLHFKHVSLLLQNWNDTYDTNRDKI
jgi:hypothetical protein